MAATTPGEQNEKDLTETDIRMKFITLSITRSARASGDCDKPSRHRTRLK